MMKLGVVMLVGMAVAAGAADDQFWIVNGTRSAMIAVQVRPSGKRPLSPWTPLMQRGPLGFNERVAMPQAAGKCPQHFDIQILFDDGRRLIKTNQPLCSPGTFKASF